MPRSVIVIGGGIAGLAAAHRLRECASEVRVTLLEASQRLGGVIHTIERDGYLIERSADSFIAGPQAPWALDLCRRIGFENELIQTDPARRKAMVVHDGRLLDVPEGFVLMCPRRLWPVVTTPLLSVAGKLRLAWEYFVPRRRGGGDESLASFARRRLGREVYERLVQPLVGGIYTADPEKLSLAATLPQFLEWERRHGGLIRGARQAMKNDAVPRGDANASAARYALFLAPRRGLSSLVQALAARLPPGTVRLGAAVERIAPAAEGGWQVWPQGGDAPLACDGLIIAVPAPAAARLVGKFDPALSEHLAGIEYAGAAVVCAAFGRGQFRRPELLESFGFVVPAVENRRILAASFPSVKFAGRAPEGRVLVRAFAGGACQPELAALPDDELARLVGGELRELLDVEGEPAFWEIARWQGAMPQYHVGHLDVVRRIEDRVALHGGLALAGNAYRGVGIPHCVRSGQTAAESILDGWNAAVAAGRSMPPA
jgi:oxygen-dependent protoporphyrinogen oxidase